MKHEHRVFARLRVKANGVQLVLKPLVISAVAPKPCTLEQLQLQLAGLPEGEFSDTEWQVTGVRLCHRQRFGNFLHFYGFRSEQGLLIEAVMRRGVVSHDDDERLSAVCALGDSATITGLIEKSKGRLSIHARLVEVDESFHSLFGERALFRDDSQGLKGGGVPRHWPARAPSMLSTPSAKTENVEPILLIQCVASHTARLQEYVRAAYGVDALAIVAPISGHKMGRDERCVAYRPMASAARLLVDLLGDVLMARYVQRWYLLEGRAPTLRAAVDALLDRCTVLGAHHGALLGAHHGALLDRCTIIGDAKAEDERHGERIGGGGGGGIGCLLPVRIQAFPRSVESFAVEQVRRSGRAEPAPKGDTLLSIAYLLNAYYYGASPLDDERTRFANNLPRPRCVVAEGAEDAEGTVSLAAATLAKSAPSLVASHVCRAYYKLHEAQARFGLTLEVTRALDVGASPGGWTVCLCSLGCTFVTAIDPGALSLPVELAVSRRVEHLQMRVEEAIPLMLGPPRAYTPVTRSSRPKLGEGPKFEETPSVEAPLAAAPTPAYTGPRYSLLVCDMNAPPSDVISMARQSLPLLEDGAPLVLTFKNPFARRGLWLEALEAGLAELAAFADDVAVLHLLANTTRETTVYGRVRPLAQRVAAAARAEQCADSWRRSRLIDGRQ